MRKKRAGQGKRFLTSARNLLIALLVLSAATVIYVQAQSPSTPIVGHTRQQIDGLLDQNGKLVADDAKFLNGLSSADIIESALNADAESITTKDIKIVKKVLRAQCSTTATVMERPT